MKLKIRSFRCDGHSKLNLVVSRKKKVTGDTHDLTLYIRFRENSIYPFWNTRGAWRLPTKQRIEFKLTRDWVHKIYCIASNSYSCGVKVEFTRFAVSIRPCTENLNNGIVVHDRAEVHRDFVFRCSIFKYFFFCYTSVSPFLVGTESLLYLIFTTK